ncbi:MAG: transglutaminase domain-containing protein [Thermoguttaceae bacterium]
MSIRSPILALFLSLAMTAALSAQFRDSEPQGVKMGDSKSFRWRAGLIITATGGECKSITGYAPIPTDWPEQQVKIVDEDISPGVHVDYKIVNGTVKIMTVKIAQLGSGQEAKALVTLEIRRRPILPPDDTNIYVLPDVKKLRPEIRQYLAPSPKIESRDAKIRSLSKQIIADKEKAWDKVEAIYDWTREHVKYKESMPLTGALDALKDGTGDCEGMTSLFIALCRAGDIPSRTVWVQGHCYPEFYLEDDKGEGHWFPCQAAGSRQFGGITEDRPVLQKGDNFKPLNGKGERQRYLAEFLTGAETGGKPRVTPIRELLGAEKTD